MPLSQSGGALVFHLLSKLYEHTSVVITTNLSQLNQMTQHNASLVEQSAAAFRLPSDKADRLIDAFKAVR